MTTTNYDFTSSVLTCITVLDFFSFMPLSRRHLAPLHLRYRISDMSTYKSEGYSIGRVSGMIRDDKREEESDDKDLGE